MPTLRYNSKFITISAKVLALKYSKPKLNDTLERLRVGAVSVFVDWPLGGATLEYVPVEARGVGSETPSDSSMIPTLQPEVLLVTQLSAYMPSCIHASMCTCVHAYLRAYMPSCIHTSLCTCVHAYLHAYMPSCTHASMCAYMPAYMPSCIHASMVHAYIRAAVHM